MSERPPHTESELVEFVRAIDVRAPEALHGRIEALVAERSATRARPSAAFGPWVARRAIAAAAVLAAIAVALLAGLGGGSGSVSEVRAASALTLRAATSTAPRQSPSVRSQLTAAVEGVAFPYWEESFGWRSVGARSDRVGGRAVTTVFYSDGRGRRVGYAIVGGAPAPHLSGGSVVWRSGTGYRLLRLGGVPTVAWLRGGRLCIVSGRGVDDATLVRLASWDDRGPTST
jgi:hypothetical protein